MSAISLLPDNRTTLETALETTLAKHLERIESPYPDLWNPSGVKAEMLPYLAHAKGVPDWGDDTDDAKRDTVANIWPVQRKAGTRAAVKQAVDALGFDAEVKRGDQPYALQVDLWREDVGTFEGDLFARVERRIGQVKSERDGFTVNVNLQSRSRIATTAFVMAADSIEVKPYAIGEIVSKGLWRFVCAYSVLDAISVYPEVK